MSRIVVTLLGPDRPGLVSRISDLARAHGANWTDSVMANFGGQFAGIVQLEVEPARTEGLLAALRASDGPALHVFASREQEGTPASTERRLELDLVGHDRPGILQAISGELARHGVSIDKLQTRIASGAMSGEPMFHMQATLSVPADLDPHTLRSGLESLANEWMVDLGFGAD